MPASSEKNHFDSVMKLSVIEFRNWYLSEMRQYALNHGKAPACTRCRMLVNDTTDLRRHFGANLHAYCFLREHAEWRFYTPEDKRYFDKVATL